MAAKIVKIFYLRHDQKNRSLEKYCSVTLQISIFFVILHKILKSIKKYSQK